MVDTLDMVNGVSKTCKELFSAWDSINTEVHLTVYGSAYDADMIHRGRQGAIVEKSGWLKLPLFGYKGYDLSVPVMDFFWQMSSVRPDIIHIATPGPLGFLALIYAKIHHLPVVYTHHTKPEVFISNLSKFQRLLFGWIAATVVHIMAMESDRVIAHSPDSLQEAYTFGAKHPVFVRMGYALPENTSSEILLLKERYRNQLIEEYHLDKGKPVIIFVGRLSGDKNIRLLSHLISHLDTTIIFVGDGPLAPYLTTCKHCIVTGFMSGEQLSAYYFGADVLMNLSVEETLGRTFIESLGHGTPVIVADSGDHLSQLPQDVNLIYRLHISEPVEEITVQHLRTILEHIRHNRRERVNMAMEYSHRYLWANLLKDHIAPYNDL